MSNEGSQSPKGVDIRPQRTVTIPLSTLSSVLRVSHSHVGAVTGITSDSRTVRPGDLYVARPGAHSHGAQYAQAAVEAGAVAIVTDQQGSALLRTSVPVLEVDDPQHVLGALASLIYPHKPPTLLAVTGTNGKTTVSYLIRALLNSLGKRCGLIGTVETDIGSQQCPSILTSPEADTTHALLARMAEEELVAAAVEVSSHALAMGRVDGIHFTVAGFTNLSQDHLDLHTSMDEYLCAKQELFKAARASIAVVCLDQPAGRTIAAGADIPVTTFVTEPGERAQVPHWRVKQCEEQNPGWSITLEGPAGQLRMGTSLPGRFNVANAALAALMVHEAGVSLEELQSVFDSHDPFHISVPGRMETVAAVPRAIVDFAHNPEGLEQACQAVKPTSGRLIVVVGATGERDRHKRAMMGEVCARYAEVVLVTDDDPHGEDPAAIRAEVFAGVQQGRGPGRAVEIMENVAPRAFAIDRAVALASHQDTILVAGRGHETWQEVAGVFHRLDDREQLRSALSCHGFLERPACQ